MAGTLLPMKNRTSNGSATKTETGQPQARANEAMQELGRRIERYRNARQHDCKMMRINLPKDTKDYLDKLTRRISERSGLKPWQARSAIINALVALDVGNWVAS